MHLNIRLSGDTANKPMGEPGMPVLVTFSALEVSPGSKLMLLLTGSRILMRINSA
jgi:hypothetical protein